jgi:hypothetical protein
MKVAPGSFKVSQLDVWNDGSRAVAAVFTPSASYILKLDLMAGESVQLSTTGTEAQYQWPRLSPDGQHTAWIRGREDLLIDGRSLFSCSDASVQFEWLDEQRIAIDCSKQIFVIDEVSGKQLAQADTQE